jgi:hypothetical protein
LLIVEPKLLLHELLPLEQLLTLLMIQQLILLLNSYQLLLQRGCCVLRYVWLVFWGLGERLKMHEKCRKM